MKKNLLIIIGLLLVFAMQNIFAQTRDSTIIRLQKNVKQLQTEMQNQQINFSKQLSEANKNIKSLREEIAAEQANFKAIADNLEARIANTHNRAEQQIHGVQQTVSKNTLYWITAALATVLLSVILFGLLSLRQKSDKTDIISQLSRTESEPDHSMALKVASEINLMERNLNLMNTETKGLKQLVRSIKKLKDNLAANGYEIPIMAGKQFHEGMKVIVVNSIPDENLEKGTEVITKILVPQVNYNGKMIQTAQIEVSVGY
jgi:type II secretory pathway pseudopilin PulG